MVVAATNVSGADAVLFNSGSFRPSPEERRVASAFFTIGAATFEMRFEFIDPVFVSRGITGQPVIEHELRL